MAALSPKEAGVNARNYEVMVILAPDLEERTVGPTLDTFLNVIRGDGAVSNIDVWGRRRLAYEINKQADGIYAVLDVSCHRAAVKELDRQLNLNEAVLRTKVVRPEASRWEPMAAGDITITVVGNLIADPELRFTPSRSGRRVVPVASTPRFFDRQTNDWKDGDSLFLRCNVWRQYAENVAESLTKGMRVIVTGRLKQRSYETREGEKRTVFEVEVDDVGPSLRNATAKVKRRWQRWRWRLSANNTAVAAIGGRFAADDPWATPPPSEAPPLRRAAPQRQTTTFRRPGRPPG